MFRSRSQDRCGALIAIPIATRAGVFVAHFSDQGLAGLDFPGRHSPAAERLNGRSDGAQVDEWCALTRTALEKALAGEAPAELPPLDMRAGTDFQRRVWTALRRIPPGQTRTYAEVAREIGSAKATRAVGSACGANPIPVLIPCHRVMASDGGPGGFSSSLNWKLLLLSVESTPTGGANSGAQGQIVS
jgi:O-6-methylguanine DNA methyltransferase